MAAGGRGPQLDRDPIAPAGRAEASARAARALDCHESVSDVAGEDGMVSDGEGRGRAVDGTVPMSEALMARCNEVIAEELPQRRPWPLQGGARVPVLWSMWHSARR